MAPWIENGIASLREHRRSSARRECAERIYRHYAETGEPFCRGDAIVVCQDISVCRRSVRRAIIDLVDLGLAEVANTTKLVKGTGQCYRIIEPGAGARPAVVVTTEAEAGGGGGISAADRVKPAVMPVSVSNHDGHEDAPVDADDWAPIEDDAADPAWEFFGDDSVYDGDDWIE